MPKERADRALLAGERKIEKSADFKIEIEKPVYCFCDNCPSIVLASDTSNPGPASTLNCSMMPSLLTNMENRLLRSPIEGITMSNPIAFANSPSPSPMKRIFP